MEKLVSLDTGLIFWTWTTFLLVLVILAWKAWGPMIAALEQREQKIADALAAADKALEDTEKMSAKYDEQIRAGRLEAQEVLAEARLAAERMGGEIEATAQQKATAIVASAREQIEAEKTKAIEDVRSAVVEMSLSIASKVLERNITSDDNRKMAAESLQQIGKA